MTGRITAVRNVHGERRGQTVLRSWTFTPLCPAGPCQYVQLTRQRAAGTDSLVLQLTAADQYSGTGSFYAPLRCRHRTVRKGELVPFTIAVQITNAAIESGSVLATQLSATYTNRTRRNLTRCVAAPRHDAATYHGSAAS